MSDTCGFTVYDLDGEEQPCDEPATGWRWYQGHDHEDMLDVACELHENEGGRRIHEAEAALARVTARAEQWQAAKARDVQIAGMVLRATLDGTSEAAGADR